MAPVNEKRQVFDVLDGRSPWALLCGDSCEMLRCLPSKRLQHVITDPPYSRDLYARTRTNKGRGTRSTGTGTPYASNEMAPHTSARQLSSLRIGASEDVLHHVAPEIMRLAQRWIIVFHDCESGHLWRDQFGEAYVRTGAWVKTDPMPQVSGDRPGVGFEPCTIAYESPGRMRWNGGGKAAVWRHGTCKGLERRGNPHPCPKPLSLMRNLIEQFTDPGDVVLDPFAGSGSTGVAALQLGRRFIGIERDPKFARYAQRRLSDTT